MMSRTARRAWRADSGKAAGSGASRTPAAPYGEDSMEFDVMTRATTWDHVATLARRTEAAGFSGMLFTEGHQVPWMNITAAALAAPSLHFSTGIAIAFARSPMVSAEIAWELAQNTKGNFRLGLGSQVKAHITRRYASPFDKPAPQMKDYVQAVKACLSAFRREGPLQHDGPYYKLSLLTEQWTPARHDYEDVKVDISAVGPIMVRRAGEKRAVFAFNELGMWLEYISPAP